jgi:hypothetical protein
MRSPVDACTVVSGSQARGHPEGPKTPVNHNKRRTFCVCEDPSPKGNPKRRRAQRLAGRPGYGVQVLDPYSYM